MKGMDTFFPRPRPGELLYSVLARYARWRRESGPKDVMFELMGTSSAIASMELPNRLARLAERIPDSSPDILYDQHTLAPYYAAFLPAEQRATLRAGMFGDASNLYVTVGLSAFRAGSVRRLRFCPDCLSSMREQWGNAHWRRDHQLPGVVVCPEHGTVLRASTVDLRTGNRHEYVAATPATCPSDAEPVAGALTPDDADTLLRISRRSSALLDAYQGPADMAELTGTYRQALRSAGLMRSSAKVDQVALHEAFMTRFGSILPHLPGLVDGEGLRGDWLMSLTRRIRKAAHPLEHVLLRDLLASCPVVAGAELSDPWQCLNPLAPHYGQHVVWSMREYRNRDARVSIYTCECGYAYTRSVSASGVLGQPRFKEYGPLLEPELVRLVSAGGSLRSVAARLRLDPKTVASLAIRHGIEVPWSIRPSTGGERMSQRRAARLRPRDAVRKQVGTRRRCDWVALDAELVAKVRAAADRIRRSDPATRVTAASLERAVAGKREWIGKRRAKLPHAFAALCAERETVADFQARRIRYQVDASIGGPLRPWEIMRLAGLRSDALPVIRAAMEVRTAL